MSADLDAEEITLPVKRTNGETLAEREANKTADVVQDQLKPVIKLLKPEDWMFCLSCSLLGVILKKEKRRNKSKKEKFRKRNGNKNKGV